MSKPARKVCGAFGESALHYAEEFGLRVVPLDGKKPTLLGGDWPNKATSDPAQLEEWLRRFRDYNIGLVTGANSDGYAGLALDVDVKHGGLEALALLEAEHGELPATWTCQSGGGGRHYYFAFPEGLDLKCKTGSLPDGLDVRGKSGVLVAPPSVHPDTGMPYTWVEGRAPGDLEQAAIPSWLLAMIQADKGAAAGRPPASTTASIEVLIAKLPLWARYMLKQDELKWAGKGKGKPREFASRSERDMALCGQMRRRQWSFEQVLEAFSRHMQNSKFGEAGNGKRYLELTWSKLRPDDAKPEIVTGADLDLQTAQAERALAEPSLGVFNHKGRLAEVVRPRTAGARALLGGPRIHPIKKGRLPALLSKAARWVAVGSDGEIRHVQPPARVCDDLRVRGRWENVRPLCGVIETPTLRSDGSLLAEPGYDERTGLLYEPGSVNFPEIQDTPSKADAKAALGLLKDLLIDFPFRTSADYAVALAAMITPLVRSSCSNTPLFLFSAHTPGSGKGLLAEIAAIIATGRGMPVQSQTRDDELRKRITSTLDHGGGFLAIDNITRPLGGGALDAALTSEIWTGRRLSVSEMITVPMTLTIFATGNNVEVRGDLVRRTLRCYLDTHDERPEQRESFRYPDIKAYCRENRPLLVASALTVCRAYIAAGRPDVGKKPLGSFTEWSRLVRDPLVWLGESDPVLTQDAMREADDPSLEAWAQVLANWYELYPGEERNMKRVLTQISEAMPGTPEERLMEAFSVLVSDRVTARSMARVAKRYGGRIVQGMRMEASSGRKRAGKTYRVLETPKK